MRSFLLQWATFLVVLAVAVVPAWLGIHFRHFISYMGWMAAFAVLAVIWLRLSRSRRGAADD